MREPFSASASVLAPRRSSLILILDFCSSAHFFPLATPCPVEQEIFLARSAGTDWCLQIERRYRMSRTRLTFAVSMAARLVCAGVSQAAIANGHYAEGVYSDYAEATGNRIVFEVTTLQSGPLSELGGQRFGDVIQASG